MQKLLFKYSFFPDFMHVLQPQIFIPPPYF